MKLIDVYEEYKEKYKDYIIIINSGIFYNVYNLDTNILYTLLKYKIKKSSTYYVVGFPINNLGKVLETLKQNNINYIVLDKDSNNRFYISDKYKDKNNSYSKYEIDIERMNYIDNRIKRIQEILESKKFENNIETILFQIEKLL